MRHRRVAVLIEHATAEHGGVPRECAEAHCGAASIVVHAAAIVGGVPREEAVSYGWRAGVVIHATPAVVRHAAIGVAGGNSEAVEHSVVRTGDHMVDVLASVCTAHIVAVQIAAEDGRVGRPVALTTVGFGSDEAAIEGDAALELEGGRAGTTGSRRAIAPRRHPDLVVWLRRR